MTMKEWIEALDAFNKKLVKKIEVKGFEVTNFRGADSHLYLEQVVLSAKKSPKAKYDYMKWRNKRTFQLKHLQSRHRTESPFMIGSAP